MKKKGGGGIGVESLRATWGRRREKEKEKEKEKRRSYEKGLWKESFCNSE